MKKYKLNSTHYTIAILLSLFMISTISYSQIDTLTQNDNEEKITKKPISLSGAVSLGGYVFQTNRETSFLQPQGYTININLNASIYGLDIPMNFNMNQQGSSFKNPFNRFGMSPSYKGITLHLGHRNYNWSEFLMSGATIYGIGLDLKIKNLIIGGIVGKVRQSSSNINSFGPPQFTRSLEAVRIGKKTKDFHFYFDIMKGKDDINSLSNVSEEVKKGLEAHENKGLSLQAKLPIKGNKVFFKSEFAISGYTNDIRNKSIIIDSIKAFRTLRKVMDIKPSTYYSSAFNNEIHFNYKKFKISGAFRSVYPEFKSFGANYLLSDIATATINPSFNLWKNKVIIAGNFGYMYNNLHDNLINKTSRNIGSLGITINPSQRFGVYAQYSNYSIYQQVIKDSLAMDSTIIDQINHNITLVPRFTIANASQIHNLVFNANYQILEDNNEIYKQYTENNLLSLNANYSMTIIATGLTLNAGYNFLEFQSSSLSTIQQGTNIGISKKIFGNKMTIGASANYSKLKSNDIVNNLTTIIGKVDYKIYKSSSINLQVYFLNNESTTNPIKETRTNVNYRMRF